MGWAAANSIIFSPKNEFWVNILLDCYDKVNKYNDCRKECSIYASDDVVYFCGENSVELILTGLDSLSGQLNIIKELDMAFETTTMQEAMSRLLEQKDKLIMDELNELTSRGLIVIEQTRPTIVREAGSGELRLAQAVRLVPKEKEYIEKLETENAELKAKIDRIENIFNGSDEE